jgi:hypothetical protein
MNRFPLSSLAKGCSLVLVTAVVLFSPSAQAKTWKVVPEEVRSSVAPISLLLRVRQSGLGAGPNPAEMRDVQSGNYTVPGAIGSVLGGFIVGAVESGRAKTSAAEIVPLLNALRSFDADSFLVQGIQNGLKGRDWLRLSSTSALRSYSLESSRDVLSAAPGPYLADVDCGYRISREFQAIYVRCSIGVIPKNAQQAVRADGTWNSQKLIYQSAVQYEFAINNFAGSRPERIEQWRGSDAALLRQGLTVALVQCGELVGRQLSLTDAEIKAINRPGARHVKLAAVFKTMAYAHPGTVVEGESNIIGYRSVGLSPKGVVIRPDSDGLLMLDDYGSLHGQRSTIAP